MENKIKNGIKITEWKSDERLHEKWTKENKQMNDHETTILNFSQVKQLLNSFKSQNMTNDTDTLIFNNDQFTFFRQAGKQHIFYSLGHMNKGC